MSFTLIFFSNVADLDSGSVVFFSVVDPGPGFYLNADPDQDPWSQINADQEMDPGQRLNFYMKK
jgi:hypothetical protein